LRCWAHQRMSSGTVPASVGEPMMSSDRVLLSAMYEVLGLH
jgi:hypothetical protein